MYDIAWTTHSRSSFTKKLPFDCYYHYSLSAAHILLYFFLLSSPAFYTAMDDDMQPKAMLFYPPHFVAL